jgi:hypothetical protein
MKQKPKHVDAVIAALEKANAEADKYFDAYVRDMAEVYGTIHPDVIRNGELFGRIGFSIDRVSALKLIRNSCG